MNFINDFIRIPIVFFTQNYWRDEVFRVLMAKNSISGIIRLTTDDGQPILYYYLLKLWMHFFGDSETATRTISIICFELLLFLMYKFGRLIKPKEKIFAFLLVFFTIINPALFYYAFETRVYMFFTLIVTLSFYLLLQKKYLWWTLVAVTGLYTHNFMIFVLMAQFLLWLRQKETLKNVIKMYAVIFICYLPWINIFWHQANLIIKDFWIKPLTVANFLTMPAGIYTGYENNPANLFGYFIVFSLITLIPIIYTAINKKLRIYFFWLFLVLLPVVAVSLFLRPIFIARYVSFLSIPLIIMTALFISGAKKRWVNCVLFLFFVLITLNANLVLFSVRIKPNVQESVIKIYGLMQKGDLIYTTSLNFFETKYYFAKLSQSGYTKKNEIKIYSLTCHIPFFVGKVLIKDEDVVCQIPADKRVFKLDNQAGITILSRYR